MPILEYIISIYFSKSGHQKYRLLFSYLFRVIYLAYMIFQWVMRVLTLKWNIRFLVYSKITDKYFAAFIVWFSKNLLFENKYCLNLVYHEKIERSLWKNVMLLLCSNFKWIFLTFDINRNFIDNYVAGVYTPICRSNGIFDKIRANKSQWKNHGMWYILGRIQKMNVPAKVYPYLCDYMKCINR